MLELKWIGDNYEKLSKFETKPLVLMAQAIESYRSIGITKHLKSKGSDTKKLLELEDNNTLYKCFFCLDNNKMVITDITKEKR